MARFGFLRKALHFVAKAGGPLLRLIGVKRGTVAGKVVEGAEIVDPLLPQTPTATPGSEAPK